ncbi:pyridoxal-phosphate dependent enzyme [Actinobacillus vicugnae]|uniref:pyridoxal-phosphate dependent enzyme n=1 Tax=Actinobacillus vicugnae TaxID=2573093 RepID=UPI001FCC06D1|nr:pyridoxal-phosphate dependent enzyme [Actinobacillus vicugnae]
MYNLEEYMGHTPLVKIKNIFGEKYANVYVKLEEFNPAGSIKSRGAHQMIIEAEKKRKA